MVCPEGREAAIMNLKRALSELYFVILEATFSWYEVSVVIVLVFSDSND